MSSLLSFGTAHFKTESEAENKDVRSVAGTNLRSSRIFLIYLLTNQIKVLSFILGHQRNVTDNSCLVHKNLLSYFPKNTEKPVKYCSTFSSKILES